jgi:hypothetical protein
MTKEYPKPDVLISVYGDSKKAPALSQFGIGGSQECPARPVPQGEMKMFSKKPAPYRNPAVELSVGIDKLAAVAEHEHVGLAHIVDILERHADSIRAKMAVQVSLGGTVHSANMLRSV